MTLYIHPRRNSVVKQVPEQTDTPVSTTVCYSLLYYILAAFNLYNSTELLEQSLSVVRYKAFASSLVLSPGYIRFRAANLRLFQEHRALSCRLSQVNDLATRAP